MPRDCVIGILWNCVFFSYCIGQFKVPYFVVILLYGSRLKFSFKEVGVSMVCCTAGSLVYLGPCSWSLHRSFGLVAGRASHYLNFLWDGVHYIYFHELQVISHFYGCWKWFPSACRHMSHVTITFTEFWNYWWNTLFWMFFFSSPDQF
jgi:hypothetical protein